MAWIVSNIKNNIMLGHAYYLFKKRNTIEYFNNVKNGKFDIKNDKIKKQLKELIDNLISYGYVALLSYQDRIFLTNIYPEYMNFEIDSLGLCSVFPENLIGNQQLIKKFIEDNNLYSSVGKSLENLLLNEYHYLSDSDKENIFSFMKYLKGHGYKIFDGLSLRDIDDINEELQGKIVDNDLMSSELADKLWTYSIFGNKKFEILDSIRDMSNSYKFWSSLPNNLNLKMSYFDLFKKCCNEDKECLNPLGMPSEKFLVKLARDKLPYYMYDFKKYFLELMIKDKNEIVIRTFFEDGKWENLFPLNYHNLNNIFSEADIYALDKCKNMRQSFYAYQICERFKEFYINSENIKSIEDIDKLYNETIKSVFKNGKWDDIIFFDYHNMHDIFSDTDIYALDKYQMLDNVTIKITFSHYYVENKISIEKIDLLCDLIKRLNSSNSIEIVNFQGAIFNELLKDDDPIKKFEEIEKIFVKNNIPVFVKLFKCFQILYSDLAKSFRFDDNQIISPELAKLNFNDSNLDRLNKNVLPNDMRLQVIFNDLFRISLGSNNHSLKEYIKNIENGNTLYIGLLSGNIAYDELSALQKETLDIFIAHLETLIENSKYSLDGDYDRFSALEKIKIIGKNFKITSRYDLPDRIVRHFLYFAGINSFEELKDKMENIVSSKDKINQERGRELENGKFILETGDFIRGVGNEFDLINSLNLGNVCKEYLGSIKGTSHSDSTPLDIDLSRITYDKSNAESISNTPSGLGGYGNYYIVIKHDNSNMTISRDSDGDKNVMYDPSKFEMFKTLADNHYGVRTGISSTDIDYIMINGDYDISKLKFEIAKNGFYIPVVNVDGNLLYNVDEYNNLKEKMKGLSYYDAEEYTLSTEHLYFPGIEEIIADMHEDREKQIKKRKALQTAISNIISSSGLGIDKINMSPTPDLSNNNADLIEIGSTSRGTNVPNDSDYDFILKVGKQQVLQNSNAILSKFNEYFKPKENNSHTNRFRGSNINIEGFDLPVDIDISIDQKRNSEIYFSDTSLQDRLNNIERQYPKDYEAVLANIVYAKELLKKEGCYKPHKSDSLQSGLGGIGVENWILQNGGSFYSAAKSFYDASVDKSFDEFKKVYKVWDFGQNHEPREKNGIIYPFDEYVYDNMAENGYQKMREVCKKYLEFVKSGKLDLAENEQLENDISIKR